MSYDAHQKAAVLRTCPACGARYYVTHFRRGWRCDPCVHAQRGALLPPWQAIAIVLACAIFAIGFVWFTAYASTWCGSHC